MTKKVIECIFSELNDYFKLDENSPSGLVRIKSKLGKPVTFKNVGTMERDEHGFPKCWLVYFKGRTHKAHRIIWVLTYGSIDPELVVDHVDGNPFNNKASNLKLKAKKDNLRNSRKRCDNTTGVSGVHINVTNEGYKYYVAEWVNMDGAAERKCFSVLKLGDIVAFNLAVEYRKKQIQRLIEEGADYTERHGT